MKKNLLILSVLLTSLLAKANVLIVEGKYQNKNIYIQNSFGSSAGVGFCTTEIKVNGKITTDEVNSSAIEIDLQALHIKIGQKVTIEIIHKRDCSPIVLNPDALTPRSTFEIVSMNINISSVLKWTAKNEVGALPFIVEQFKWNKWVPVGEVQGVGTPENNDYSFIVITHSGENKFRVKQIGFSGVPKYSAAIMVNSVNEKPTYILDKNYKTIQYSKETSYELYDAFGNVVKKGFGTLTEISNLPKGKYYMCYDNDVVEIEKKK